MEGRLILLVVIISDFVRTESLYEQECNYTSGLWREV
jgi:hypothetical protein